MGIPKYYRWISERYPCLSQVVRESEVPDFDNLYLDMNGIIHTCSHPSDDVNFRLTEEKMFEDICSYIETLFRIIRPQRVFYMAIDGCAPRAKMNQQRARRFRSAKEAEEARKKAEREGTLRSDEDGPPPFDSNCITPGTPFMHRLHQHLEYFVQAKLTTDPAWQGIRVILSGHQVPGEGEHKIMDFIRSEKLRPDYDPNTRHCLYGLDADLIILGLVSHEPHFSLLREEVRFGRRQKKKDESQDNVFHLLSLSLYREYLRMEFYDVKPLLSFPFDFERLLDDWVLLGFLIGNDFIPHLPHFHISQEIVPTLYSCYKLTLQKLDGWITDGGTINMSRLQVLLEELSVIDRNAFEDTYVDLKWMRSKSKRRDKDGEDATKPVVVPPSNRRTQSSDDGAALASLFGGVGVDEDKEEDEEADETSRNKEEQEIFEAEYLMHKANYYLEKLGVQVYDDEFRLQQSQEYVRGLQWILFYYYKGVPSWSWFFPSHYAPFVSDIRGIEDFVPDFELGTPFTPFEQLMSVLPPASQDHVPPAYRPLMTDKDSPIRDFYPLDFKSDLNGKRNAWEAVVLIPFIDQDRLQSAVAEREHLLSDAERNRNKHALARCYVHSPVSRVRVVSPHRHHFAAITAHADFTEMSFPHTPEGSPHVGLHPRFDHARYYPGFPTFVHLPHKFLICKARVKVFNFESKSDSIVVIPHNTMPTSASELKHLVGQEIWTRYPHLVEAKVTAVSDSTERYEQQGRRVVPTALHGSARAKFRRAAENLQDAVKTKRGLDIGHVHVVLTVTVCDGFVNDFNKDGRVYQRKSWSRHEEDFPAQLCIPDLQISRDTRNEAVKVLKEVIRPEARVCFLGPDSYGATGRVLQVHHHTVDVELMVPSSPNIAALLRANTREQLVPLGAAAHQLRMPDIFLNKLLGSLYVFEGTDGAAGKRFDLGFHMKFSNRGLEAVGLTRRMNDQWFMTQRAVQLVDQFYRRFARVLDPLKRNAYADRYYAQDLYPFDVKEDLQRAVTYLEKEAKIGSFDLVPTGTEVLQRRVVHAIEKVQEVFTQSKQPKPRITIERLPPSLLFLASTAGRNTAIPPDKQATFKLGDRVVCVRDCAAVPWAAAGFVVRVLPASEEVEVVFDEEFMGGTTLGGLCSRLAGARMPFAWLVNVTHGLRRAVQEQEYALFQSATVKALPPLPAEEPVVDDDADEVADGGRSGRAGDDGNHNKRGGAGRGGTGKEEAGVVVAAAAAAEGTTGTGSALASAAADASKPAQVRHGAGVREALGPAKRSSKETSKQARKADQAAARSKHNPRKQDKTPQANRGTASGAASSTKKTKGSKAEKDSKQGRGVSRDAVVEIGQETFDLDLYAKLWRDLENSAKSS